VTVHLPDVLLPRDAPFYPFLNKVNARPPFFLDWNWTVSAVGGPLFSFAAFRQP
jgi:hypothetical protein